MAQGTLKIHTQNLLPIIKKWLYSDKDIFLRELVSNSCDALHKLKVLREQGECSFQDEELRIDIEINASEKTLSISDTGIGMSGEEVEKYIAQIAFSGAEEFVSRYQKEEEKEQIIGHFGLGFYSAYMVAKKVEIHTLSYRKEEKSAFWSCDGSTEYTLEEDTKTDRGTSIILHIAEDSEEFLQEEKLRQILERYCAFLPFPIYLNKKQVNHKDPLWLKNAHECSDQDYLDFYRRLYPFAEDPIFWVHLNVDYPFRLKGILYFPKINKRFDWTKNKIKLFSNRVFVSDNCKDLIPDFLMVLEGAIDSPDIPLNVSRSTLQMSRTVHQLSSHISKKVADRLATLYQTSRETFIKNWTHIELIIKLGMMQDDKFYEKCKEFLIWKTLDGQWLTLEEYKGKQGDREKVFYAPDDKPSPFLTLYKEKEICVLQTNSYVDTALMSFLEHKLAPLKFQRVDGAIDESILDAKREKTLLDQDGKTEATRIADFFRSKLSSIDKLEVEAKSLTNDTVPAFVVLDEEMRRMKDYMALSNQNLPEGLPEKRTFVLNTNSKLVSLIYGLREKDSKLAEEMAHQLYDLSLLSQKELSSEALANFVNRSSQILETLASRGG